MTLTILRRVALGSLIVALGTSGAQAQIERATSVAELFGLLDSNSDNVLEKREIPEAARPSFEQLLRDFDTNGDKRIDGEEYRELLLFLHAEPGTVGSKKPGSKSPDDAFKAMDKNGDGKISKKEFSGNPLMFERIDGDKDGFLTQKEIARAKSAEGLGVSRDQQFRALDKDGDGKLDRDEYPGSGLNFMRLDSNKDGFLSPYELMTPAEREAAARFEEIQERLVEEFKKSVKEAEAKKAEKKESAGKKPDGKGEKGEKDRGERTDSKPAKEDRGDSKDSPKADAKKDGEKASGEGKPVPDDATEGAKKKD